MPLFFFLLFKRRDAHLVLSTYVLANDIVMIPTRAESESSPVDASKITTLSASPFAPTIKQRQRQRHICQIQGWFQTTVRGKSQGFILRHQPPQFQFELHLLLGPTTLSPCPPSLVFPHLPRREAATQYPCATRNPHDHPNGSQPPVRAPRRIPYHEDDCGGEDDGAGVKSHNKRGEHKLSSAMRGVCLSKG